MTAKLIHTDGAFEIYKAGHVIIIQRDGEFFCNLRKADRGFANPAHHVAEILRVEAEVAADNLRAEDQRRANVTTYIAARADRVAAQPMFAF
jgi:hypothetical protein